MRQALLALLMFAAAPVAAAEFRYVLLVDSDPLSTSDCSAADQGLAGADWRFSARAHRGAGSERILEACRGDTWVRVDAGENAVQLAPGAGADGSDRIEWTQAWTAPGPSARAWAYSQRVDGGSPDLLDADGEPSTLRLQFGDFQAAVPALGWPGLLLLAGALGWFGRRASAARSIASCAFALAGLLVVDARGRAGADSTIQIAADALNDHLDPGLDLAQVSVDVLDGALRLRFDVNDIEAAGLPDTASVLFIGNSLTYSNDLPDILEGIAAQAGLRLDTTQIAEPNAALEDHFRTRSAHAELARGGHALVVLQQGPSSLPENQAHLATWTRRFDPLIRAGGARPALYMVWPDRTRLAYFDAVRESYSNAAEAVDGMFIPAGEAWRAAWALDPDLPLYDSDDFHPSALGSYAAALSMYCAFYGRSPVGLPARVDLPGGGSLRFTPAEALAVQRAAWAAHRQYARSGH